MNTHIIAIHGLNNKPAQQTLRQRWIDAIQEGLERNVNRRGSANWEIEMVYWADLGYPSPLPDDEAHYGYRRHPGDGPLPEYKSQWVDNLLTAGKGAGGSVLDLLGAVAKREIVSDALLNKQFKDLGDYYLEPGHGEKVRARLLEALARKPAGEKVLLLAHSMGTIVAMDVLRGFERGNGSGHGIQTFITLGAPLGLPYVIYQQRENFGRPATPEGIARWGNFADKRDRICFDTHLADDYAANADKVKVVDDLIFNTHPDNPHDAHGYLRCPEFSRFFAEEVGA